MWPNFNRKTRRHDLSPGPLIDPIHNRSAVKLRISMAVLTGNWTVGVDVRRLVLPYYDFLQKLLMQLKAKFLSSTFLQALSYLSIFH